MKWRIRESRNGWYAEQGIEIGSVECTWKPGYTMPGFIVYRSARFDTKRQAEKYIEQHS